MEQYNNADCKTKQLYYQMNCMTNKEHIRNIKTTKEDKKFKRPLCTSMIVSVINTEICLW